MTDKEKIRAEIERLHSQSLADENRQADRGLERAASVSYGKSKACKELLSFIDSLQEEPVSGLDNGDMSIERWKQAVKAASHQRSYRSSKGLTETKDDYFVDGVQWADEHPKEEPVSEELDVIAREYAGIPCDAPKDLTYCVHDKKAKYDAVLFGANWKEQQFEKNRLKHCNSITNEQAELEQGFIDQHLDKYQRMPTFLDAIEYGIRLQKEKKLRISDVAELARDEMKATAVDAECFGFQGNNALFSIKLPQKDCLVGSKVKVIVIKED